MRTIPNYEFMKIRRRRRAMVEDCKKLLPPFELHVPFAFNSREVKDALLCILNIVLFPLLQIFVLLLIAFYVWPELFYYRFKHRRFVAKNGGVFKYRGVLEKRWIEEDKRKEK